MDKRFLAILGTIVIIFIGIFVISQNSSDSSGNNKSGTSSSVTKHVQGQNQKGITFQEYGDYQCPICEAYYQPVKTATAPLLNDIHFQFSNLPLSPNPHPNAFAAARAAEAAALQNKFWEMHDKLYETQNEWSGLSNPQPKFEQYAKDLGLNVTQFSTDYASSKVNDVIIADLNAFQKTGQEKATPTFFLNGVYVPNSNFSDPQTGAPSADKITSYLNAQIAQKK
ncbi:thioredoxin domain-containing protein [Candidatus Saccharibacteria bacterium]|nr:thioredoxin domain-containing protein [Candidatus Saccharibacteria bacterium]